MNKRAGIFGLLVFVCLFTAIINPRFVDPLNIQNTLRWIAEFGIISIGVAIVIVTGGIDLSIGSVVALVGCLLPLGLEAVSRQPAGAALSWTLAGTGLLLWLGTAAQLHVSAFRDNVRRGWVSLLAPPYGLYWAVSRRDRSRWLVAGYLGGAALCVLGWLLPDALLPPWVAVSLVLLWLVALSGGLGYLHGVLITRLRLQPFVVTLCGLLFYRGIARWLTRDQTQGFGRENEDLRRLAVGRPCTLAWLLLALGLAAVLWAGWRLVATRRGRREGGVAAAQDEPLFSPWSVLGLGAVLVVAGALHLAQGLDRLPLDAVSWCQQLLFWSGLVGAVGTIAVLTAGGLRRRDRLLIAAECIGGLGILFLWGAVALGRMGVASWLRVPATAVALLLTMGGWSWFLRAAWRDVAPVERGPGSEALPSRAPGLGRAVLRRLTCGAAGGMGRRTAAVLAMGSGVFLLLGLTPIDRVEVPAPLLILLGIAILAGVFLDFTIYGRYLLALGRNEEAARYSGINTQALILTAYVLCALLAGIAGILFALDVNSVQPSVHGNFYELYAIAAAVLGGCSLRGGEGSILGVIIGTAVIRVLYNAINFLGIPTQLEFAVLGAVILAGVIADELLTRWRRT
jgi:ribose/xylose/arabinose/galactoside ABC-type transport system permease subunit